MGNQRKVGVGVMNKSARFPKEKVVSVEREKRGWPRIKP